MKKIKLAALLILATVALTLSACARTETTQEPNQPTNNGLLYVDVTTGDVDWAGIHIIIDGRKGIVADLHTAEGEDFPTHVPLIPVTRALGIEVHMEYSDPMGAALEGLLGPISFTIGSPRFMVSNRTVDLWHPPILVNGEIYVPIPFFRDVYGMGQAMWMGGIVYIDAEAFDDMR